jgi:hypothetical protein
MFYVGDYDAAAWMYQRMPDLWADPRRGEVPLSWAFSPVLARRVPMVFDYLWRTRSVNDFFMAADNGAGYLNPAMLVAPRPLSGLPSGVENWRAHCAAHYARWDMDITGFIIDGRAPQTPDEVLDAYATFSPAGVVMQYDNVDYRLHGGNARAAARAGYRWERGGSDRVHPGRYRRAAVSRGALPLVSQHSAKPDVARGSLQEVGLGRLAYPYRRCARVVLPPAPLLEISMSQTLSATQTPAKPKHPG